MEDLLRTFRDDPEFGSFHLDGQYVVIEDYLEIMPEREAEIRELVRQGKLILGPWYILQDEFLVSSEANARNLLIGIKASEKFGGVAEIGYFPDSFGNMGQAPQLISQALKAGEESGDLFLRVFNVKGESASLKLKPPYAEAAIYESSIMEAAGPALERSADGEFVQDIGPAKIATVGISRP
jgi:alpha-mannosidase